MPLFTQNIQNICAGLIESTVNVSFIYYTHIPLIIISMFIGIFVYSKSKRLLSKILFILSLNFSIFLLFSLVTWTSIKPDVYMFSWSFFSLLISLIFILCFYFSYVFLFNKDLNLEIKFIFLILLMPIFLITPTKFGLKYFDSMYCVPVENTIFSSCYVFGIISFFAILFIFFKRNKQINDVAEKKKNTIFVIGIEIFILMFFFSSFLVGYLNDIGSLNSYSLEQYGFIGMVIFMAFLAYLIVKFKAFDIKLLATQALTWAVIILVGSQFFFIQSNINKILNAFTLVTTSILSLIIVRSVKKEVALKEQLEVVNTQQTNLLHFISHQVKGFFTKSRNAFSGLLEGDYGPIPETARHIIQEGFDSDNRGVETVQQILSAANLKTGKTTYVMNDTNLVNVVKDILLILKPASDKKSLVINFNPPVQNLIMKLDTAQITQALKNLIDNSIKYTPSGKIDITLEVNNEKKEAILKVSDTGVGISSEDMPKLFSEGGRGKDSIKVNVDSTGYGLYIVKNIIEAHGGSVTVHSDGPGKGSVFTVVLPVK